MSTATAAEVSAAFVAILRGWLTPEEWAEMARSNAANRAAGEPYCASHEYCDPNQAMIDACDALRVDWRAAGLVDAAWTLARPTLAGVSAA